MYALIFPGQGSQRPGMGRPWQDTRSWALVEQLGEQTGRDIAHLLTDAGADELTLTSNSQLATFTLSLVILDAARPMLGVDHDGLVAVAGHSLGEYTALVAAGALTPGEGARLVTERGLAMQAAAQARPGTMAAVLGLDPEAVAAACAGVEDAWVANDNAPGQIVIAGSGTGVDQAGANARDGGAKRVVPLAVGGAFHTPFMGPAQDRLDAALAGADFGRPAVTCVANVDAEPHDGDWPGLLARQLSSPVRWRESLLRLADLGVLTFIELGPGTELSGMVKRTVAGAGRAHVAVPDDLSELASLIGSGPG